MVLLAGNGTVARAQSTALEPYRVGPYGADRYRDRLGPSEEFEKEGFIFVFQDVRGRFMSEGEFVNMRPHIDDK